MPEDRTYPSGSPFPSVGQAFFVPISKEDFIIKPPALSGDNLYVKELMNLNLIFIQIHAKYTIAK